MREVFVGSEALAAGGMTRAQPALELSNDLSRNLHAERCSSIASAEDAGRLAMVGARRCHRGPCRCGDSRSALGRRDNTHRNDLAAAAGRRRASRCATSESMPMTSSTIGGIPVTTPERTAFDLARHLPRDLAVVHLDALARATGIAATQVSIARRPLPKGPRSTARPNRVAPDGRRSAITAGDTAATDSHRRWFTRRRALKSG